MEYETKELKQQFEKRDKLFKMLDVYTAEINFLNTKISKDLVNIYAGREIAFTPGNEVASIDAKGRLNESISPHKNFQIYEIASSNTKREIYFWIRNVKDQSEIYQITHNNFNSFIFVEQ